MNTKPTNRAVAFTGNNILGHMETLLAGARPEDTAAQKDARFNTLVDLNDRLVPYLRNQNTNKWTGELIHPTPNWEAYPLARNWFTQNSVMLFKKKAAQEAA